jgi:hypothetical protein
MEDIQSINAKKSLIDALERLSASASEQIKYLRKLGVLPSIDELALEFDDAFVLLPELVQKGYFTDHQANKIRLVDHHLSIMSDKKQLWTIKALESHSDWAEIRRLATAALHSIESTT